MRAFPLPNAPPDRPDHPSAFSFPFHRVHGQLASEIEVGAVPFEHGFFRRPDPGLVFGPLHLLDRRHETPCDAGNSKVCGVHQVYAMVPLAGFPNRHRGGGVVLRTVVGDAQGTTCSSGIVQLGFPVLAGDTPPLRAHEFRQSTGHRLVFPQSTVRHLGPFALGKMGFKLGQGPRSPFVPLPKNNLGVLGLNGHWQQGHGRKGRGFSPRLQSARLTYFCRVKT